MILSKEQINKYLRNIIMPEISGQGQKKLLEYAVLIYGETVDDLSPLIYYLSASGVGKIYCKISNNNNFDDLINDIKDYNPDILLKYINENESIGEEINFRIFLGNVNYIKNICVYSHGEELFIPAVIATYNQWRSMIQNFDNKDDFDKYINLLKDEITNASNPVPIFPENFSSIISCSVLGTLCSIECLKQCLKIGNVQNENLYLDIFSMEIVNEEQNNVSSYMNKLCKGNNLFINYEDIYKKLDESKVLIVGAGGLGSPAAYVLALSGVGTIGLIDNDKVELSNLNRQIMHTVSRIGMEKIESAEIFLKNIKPNLNVNTYASYVNKDNVGEIIKDYHMVISAVDNIQTRHILNDACVKANKPMIDAGALRFNGTSTTIIPKEGHCYSCLFPHENTDAGLTCSEAGIFGPVVGLMGFIQASEALKIIAEFGNTLKNKILIFDAMDLDFALVDLEKNANCPVCG